MDMFTRASSLTRGGQEFLVEEVRPGAASLIYGAPSLLERALYRLAAVWVAGGERMLVVSFVDYHESQLLDTYSLAEYMLAEGVAPVEGLRCVYLATIYNKRQAVSLEYGKLLKYTGASLVALYRVSRLFRHAEYPLLLSALSRAKEVLGRGLPLVLFVDESPTRRGWPDAPAYLLHFASSVVWLRGLRGSFIEATLVKSPARPEQSRTFTREVRGVEGWF